MVRTCKTSSSLSKLAFFRALVFEADISQNHRKSRSDLQLRCLCRDLIAHLRLKPAIPTLRNEGLGFRV